MEGFLIVSNPLGVEMPEEPEDLPWRNHLSLSIWGGWGDSLPGLEDLLHPRLPVAERGHGSRKLGLPPCLSLPPPVLSLQLQKPLVPQPRCRREPLEGRLGSASAGPTADLPLGLSPRWSLWLKGVARKAGLDLGQGGCVGHTERWTREWMGALHRTRPFPGSPVEQNVASPWTCYGTWLVLGSCAWK